MGKTNKQRRSMKAKKRARRTKRSGSRTGHSRRTTQPPSDRAERVDYDHEFSEPVQVQKLLAWLLYHTVDGTEPLARALEAFAGHRRSLVATAIEAEFATLLPRLWDFGWLPAEVLRQVRRSTSSDHERMLACAVSAYHQKVDPAILHDRWRQHVADLHLGQVKSDGWFLELAATKDTPWVMTLMSAVDTIVAAETRICLETIIPAPGTKTAKESVIEGRVATADPMLEKVRNLLAQAESTKFDAEAEAFTAKAQELMARHSLDEALVWGRADNKTRPVVIRIPIDEPYLDAKSLLVQVVAEQSRCRAVFFSQFALSSIVGFESDVHATETLFTSLLVQAQSALARTASASPAGSRSRSRSFRASFLSAYASRIGERLAETNDHVQSAVTESGAADLLPVLARRSSAVDDAVDEWFADLTTSEVRGGYDASGYVHGRKAANEAQLARR